MEHIKLKQLKSGGIKIINIDKRIVNVLKHAAKKSFESLFKEHEEQFYYCTFIQAEDGTPFIFACSYEGLDRTLEQNGIDKNDENERSEFKWSYADSPYCAYGYDDEAYDREFEIRLNSMEEAMRQLDEEGLFGVGEERKKVVVIAEVMPPDYTYTERALRLNPREALTEWLEECAEDEDEEDYYNEIWHPQLCEVILCQPVLEKQMMVKLKKVFYYEGDMKSLMKGCENPPFILKKEVYDTSVNETEEFYHIHVNGDVNSATPSHPFYVYNFEV